MSARAARMPGANTPAVRRVETFAQADVVIFRRGAASDWYRLRDDRPMDVSHDPDLTVHGYEGTFMQVRSWMKTRGVRTYLIAHKHFCEHEGCRKFADTKHCPAHCVPEQDVIFCAMSGIPLAE